MFNQRETMERAILFTNQGAFENYSINSQYKRIYFGNEFCQKLIPLQKALEKVLKHIRKRNLYFTLLTPFVTDWGLDRLDRLFYFLVKNLASPEVVINDWGVLDLINDKYKQIQPILGRLMFKPKRDPRLVNIIKGNQRPTTFTDSQGRKVIVLPKKIPSALRKAYSKSNVDFWEVRNFLLSKRIRRIEVDNLLQGLLLDLPPDISASVYVPFGYITTTRYCPMLTEKQKKERITECKRECQRYFWKMRASCMPKVIYKKGNVQFYKNFYLSIKRWKKMGIDRIVYEPELPI